MERPSHHIGVNLFVERDGSLLLGKRKGASGEGQWGLVGGHLEQAETFTECALRELAEEAGMHADSVSFVGVTHQALTNGQKHYVNFLFQVHGLTGEPTVCEPDYCDEWRWFPLTALPENIFFGHVDLIRNHIDGKQFSEWKTT